jgi:hypothetical protein
VGLVGYLILMTGAVAEVFGVHLGLALSLPGGLWEITLALWLILKGFQPAGRTGSPLVQGDA